MIAYGVLCRWRLSRIMKIKKYKDMSDSKLIRFRIEYEDLVYSKYSRWKFIQPLLDYIEHQEWGRGAVMKTSLLISITDLILSAIREDYEN